MSEQHRPSSSASSSSSSSSSNIQDQYLIITDIYGVREKVVRSIDFNFFKQIIVHRKKVRFFSYAVLFALTVTSVSFPPPTLEDSNPRRD